MAVAQISEALAEARVLGYMQTILGPIRANSGANWGQFVTAAGDWLWRDRQGQPNWTRAIAQTVARRVAQGMDAADLMRDNPDAVLGIRDIPYTRRYIGYEDEWIYTAVVTIDTPDGRRVREIVRLDSHDRLSLNQVRQQLSQQLDRYVTPRAENRGRLMTLAQGAQVDIDILTVGRRL